MVPLDAHFAVGNFLRDGLAGGPIRVAGDGTPYRSYLHAADLMVWLWTILISGPPGRAYNVGSDRALTIAALARKVADLFGTDVQIAREAVPGQPPQRHVPSIRRAREELGLDVRIELEERSDARSDGSGKPARRGLERRRDRARHCGVTGDESVSAGPSPGSFFGWGRINPGGRSPWPQ